MNEQQVKSVTTDTQQWWYIELPNPETMSDKDKRGVVVEVFALLQLEAPNE